jgi:TolB-like protein
MDELFQAMRRHRLDRVGAAYAVVAWAIVQGASIALPAFDAPSWVMRWTIVVAIAGLPVALVLAWHVNEHSDVAARQGWRRWLVPGALAAVLAASMVQLALYWSRPEPVRAPVPMVASVAVLPFANLSGDPAKRYFSDGIADQLISELSRRRNLRVAARTSSFAFGGGTTDIRTIARALGVHAVVEGSVREDGNRVRIAAELINASDGFPIWSDSYDRDLTSILALQDDIARAISRALSRKLTGSDGGDTAPRKAQPAIDPEAYRDYLEGQFYFAQRSEDGINRAIALYEQATARAPFYADGFAALGQAHATLALNFVRANEVGPATVAIGRALALDPKNRIALMARSTTAIVAWKWRAAADDILKIGANDPGAPGLWHSEGVFLSYMGLTKLALPAIEKAVRQDPLSFIDRYNLALYLLNSGRKDEAIGVVRAGMAIQPGSLEGQALVCQVDAARGDFAQADSIHAQLASVPQPEALLPALTCAYYIATAKKDAKTVLAIADGAAKTFPANRLAATDIAIAYARGGDIQKALGWFETAYELREPQLCATPYNNSELTALYADPRWKALRDRPEFRDWEEARLEIAKRFQLGE